MATVRRLASGVWQAQVARRGVRKSKTFSNKLQARDWAAREEHLIVTGVQAVERKRTFRDALERYEREVSPTKRGTRWEAVRLRKIASDKIAAIRLGDVSAEVLAQWRDQRLTQVSAATVRREMVLLSHVLTVARREWGWLSTNPMSDVRKPSSPPARDRRITAQEIDDLVTAAGSDFGKLSGRAGQAFLFALETAMRAGEICALRWRDLELERRVAHLTQTKNGTARDVPLSSRAVALVQALPRTHELCFNLSARQLDTSFRHMKAKCTILNLHFHDSRHEAITRLANKLDVLALARVVGHKDIKMLQVYYNETAEELALRLQ